jgi:hypothetical protein
LHGVVLLTTVLLTTTGRTFCPRLSGHVCPAALFGRARSPRGRALVEASARIVRPWTRLAIEPLANALPTGDPVETWK